MSAFRSARSAAQFTPCPVGAGDGVCCRLRALRAWKGHFLGSAAKAGDKIPTRAKMRSARILMAAATGPLIMLDRVDD